MVKRLLILFGFLIILGGCSENKPKEESSYIEDIVKELTSDEMAGRLTGTKGNDLAVQFIEEKYKEIGLETVRQDDSYLIEYSHKFYDPEKLKFQIKITSDNGEVTELKRGVDYLERTGFTNYEENYPITFDVNDAQLENSFIVLENRESFQQVFDKAKGILVVEEQLGRYLNVDTIEKPMIQITKKTYDILKKESQGKIEIISLAEQETIQAFNVVGKIQGKDHTNAVIISAHLDHVGTVGDIIYRGAIDNATGTSVLLDVAQKLKDTNVAFEKDIIFVAFNGEESGLQGSKHFTEYIKGKYEHIYNINLDSIYDGPLDVVSGDEESLKELIGDLSNYFEEHNISSKIDNSGGLTSDHTSFLDNHINAVSIGSQNIFSKIHRPLDTKEEVNFPFLNKVSEAVAQFLIKHDNKLYEHVHTESSGEEISPAEEERFKKIQEVRDKETQKLKYDEYMLFKYEENYGILLEHHTYKFKDLKEFSYYYPNIKYSEYMNDYKLKDISISNRYSEERSSLELDKIYKREILPGDIQSISLNYYLQNEPKQVFDIKINKELQENEHYGDEMIEKEIVVNNKTYYLQFDLEQTILYNFSYKHEVNNQLYTIAIGKGEEVIIDYNGKPETGVKSTLTEQEVENIIHNYNLDEIVKETLNSL